MVLGDSRERVIWFQKDYDLQVENCWSKGCQGVRSSMKMRWGNSACIYFMEALCIVRLSTNNGQLEKENMFS